MKTKSKMFSLLASVFDRSSYTTRIWLLSHTYDSEHMPLWVRMHYTAVNTRPSSHYPVKHDLTALLQSDAVFKSVERQVICICDCNVSLTVSIFFSQRSTGISEAARCPTTGGTFGLLNSGRRTSTVSWGCTGNGPAAWRNAQVRHVTSWLC